MFLPAKDISIIQRGYFMSNLSSTMKNCDELINKTRSALEKHGINVIVVDSKEESLEVLKELIPSDVEVMTGSSTTLIQNGFMDYYLSPHHPWKNIGTPIFQEQNKLKQMQMRRKSVSADYFVASVNAITENGQLVAVDRTGSRVGAYPFSAEKVIIVSGVNKIVPTLNDAFDRIRKVVLPLENERAKKRYGTESAFGKWVIIEDEVIKNRITLILVKE